MRVRGTKSSWILSCTRLPGIIDSGNTAILLGINARIIPILVAKKLLKPVGRQHKRRQVYYFHYQEVESCRNNRNWYDKIKEIESVYWETTNAAALRRRKSKKGGTATPASSASHQA